MVHVCRYLHRALVPDMKRLVAVGGVLVYTTFLVGAHKPRKAKHKLAEGELRSWFPESCWKIICSDDAGTVPDGRPVASIVAQRTAPDADTS